MDITTRLAEAAGRRRRRVRRQDGFVLLAIAMVLAVGLSAVFFGAVSSRDTRQAQSAAETRHALQAAKRALIAYAVTNPTRPGALPCPDLDRNGRYMPASVDTRGAVCASSRGWLPYRTLDLPELVDGSGARLWYVVGEAHWPNRAGAPPLNSDTPGGLSIDGSTDWSAVVLAPGAAAGAQSRRGAGESRFAPEEVTSFLEAGNAQDPSANRFGIHGNDAVIGVSRRELMAAVERRVLRETLGAIERHRNATDNVRRTMPWLSPFDDPLNQQGFPSTPGVADGWLPMPRPDGAVSTGFEVSWRFEREGMRLSGRQTLDGVSLRDEDLLTGEAMTVPVEEGMCIASAVDRLDCVGQSAWQPATSSEGGDTIERRYGFSFRLRPEVETVASIAWPDSSSVRRRSVRVAFDRPVDAFYNRSTSSALARRSYLIELVMRNQRTGIEKRRRLRALGPVRGRLVVDGIRFPISDASGELPGWYVRNEWYRYMRVAIASPYRPGEPLPVSGICSSAPARCLALVSADGYVSRNSLVAVAMSAGPALSGQAREGVATELAALFEGRNVSANDSVYEIGAYRDAFNDQLAVLEQ